MEGKGNGIKTVIVNMVDVAKALCRPPTCECTHGHTDCCVMSVIVVDDAMYSGKPQYCVVVRDSNGESLYKYQSHALCTAHEHTNSLSTSSLSDACKYFGCELGAQTQMAGGRYIVNGAHEGQKLQELLDGFIRRFVLCSECENPETDLVSVVKGGG